VRTRPQAFWSRQPKAAHTERRQIGVADGVVDRAPASSLSSRHTTHECDRQPLWLTAKGYALVATSLG
jgi:hypothetical protein